MLRELQITNFAIIENQTISFGSGMNVITGETGSGKSIVLGAMESLLGARVTSTSIRSGAESLEVQGLFDLSSLSPAQIESLPELVREELVSSEGAELVLTRTLNLSGKSKVYINGRLGTVRLLEEISSRLISLCGQNQHVELMDSGYQRELLDRYAQLDQDLAAHNKELSTLKALHRELDEIEARSAAAAARREELAELVEELGKIGPREGLRAALDSTVRSGINGEQLKGKLARLTEKAEENHGIENALRSVGQILSECAKLEPKLAPALDSLNDLRAEFSNLMAELNRHARQIDLDEQALERARSSLSELARLERKYRTDDAGLVRLLRAAEEELAIGLGRSGQSEIAKQAEIAEQRVKELAHNIDQARRAGAKRLELSVRSELGQVALAGARFEVSVSPPDALSERINEVAFSVSMNKGEPIRPLKSVASGGELARITLVLKNLLSQQNRLNVLVFDEVDVGISGSVARAVGERLRSLASGSQVICVTHLPQVASLADHHLKVTKESGERTTAKICHLSRTERVDEIARMLAGYKITPAARASAQELLAPSLNRVED